MRRGIAVPGILLLVAACAGMQRDVQPSPLLLAEQSPGMFVGHSQYGDVVVAASHYDAMNGLAVASADLGLSARRGHAGNELMMCRREMPTGSHVHLWMCRYAEDIEASRTLLQNELAAPRLSPSRSGVAVPASGGGGRLQSN